MFNLERETVCAFD